MNDESSKEFLRLFPSISEQEQITDEVMNALEGGDSCTESCLQGCKKKNLKSGNHGPTMR